MLKQHRIGQIRELILVRETFSLFITFQVNGLRGQAGRMMPLDRVEIQDADAM